ncbi:glycosyltransferase family 2 protein [Archangium sp.]|uniref:glycosyltransferase family 2 protein n=1 Tax=Archangium sp. TaxID=1872627 RepID=UPI002D70D724|nr:glycosyltransferase family 2 protein [Archangium sp.]HYO53240.1 glycosyltransferase family 2 protein [Archangium sp.]
MSAIPTCSLVIPVFNEEEVLPELYRRVTQVMAAAETSYELVLIDDGSSDKTWEIMQRLRASDERVSLVRLSRNFGHQIALTAGLEHARGETVVVLDADLQDPPELIPRMLELWREGHDVVYGVRTRREGEGIFKRSTAAVFYRLIGRLTSVHIPADTGDFRLMSRPVVEALKRVRERNRFVRGLVAWVGFRQVGLPYERAHRAAGETKYPFSKMLRFAVDAIISFSILPLRLATGFGFLVSFFSFAYAAHAVYLKVVTGESLPGWASLMVGIAFLGGVQLLCLGIVGEYLGRIYDEVKARPLYLLQDFQSGPMAKEAARGAPADRTTAA